MKIKINKKHKYSDVSLLQSCPKTQKTNNKMAQQTAHGDYVVTCSAPVNIAVIKYWGKRHEKLILPCNSSLSATLNQDDLKSTTTVMASKDFSEDELWLNGKKEDIQKDRVQIVLDTIRNMAAKNNSPIASYKVKIVSLNNFPTAAGLASSASGYCCMAYSLAQLFGLVTDDKSLSVLSRVARVGSGSACRSMFGGWVKWEMGTDDEQGLDSVAIPVVSQQHWPEICILVLVVSDQKKHTGSTDGMKLTIKTSPSFQKRVPAIPGRMQTMEKALNEKDFETFAATTIMDSDDMHACCEDTVPSIVYVNETSRYVQNIVKKYNASIGHHEIAYTFDAGPNAVLFFEKKNFDKVAGLIEHYFPNTEHKYKKIQVPNADVSAVTKQMDAELDILFPNRKELTLKYALHTNAGDGPRVYTSKDHLINLETKQPL